MGRMTLEKIDLRLKKAAYCGLLKCHDINGGRGTRRGEKLAFDKERFELLLYGFSRKKKQILLSPLSGGCEPPN